MNDELVNTLKAIRLIKDKHEKELYAEVKTDIIGAIRCPVCDNILSYTISSYNGHIWGKCHTDCCIGWMM